MDANWTALSLAIVYIVAMGVISYAAKRFANTAHNFTSGATTYPAVLVGFLLMSEFIGTTASVGTAQAAYKWGISAAWNLAALGIGFVLYSFLFARKFRDLGENTISGVLAKTYGNGTKIATSIIMIVALQIVAISVYASGGAVLAGLLHIHRPSAIVITGLVAALYVGMGGMRSVIHTNVMHAIVKYIGILVATGFALSRVGGLGELHARLPASMFAVDTAGWPQIFAWILAGTGAVFSTQYVLQAISTVGTAADAQKASLWTSVLLIPFGIAAAICGMCASLLFPKINALQAFPMIVAQMDSLMAAVVVAGLAGSLFGTISAISIGSGTLLYKDFYLPAARKGSSDAKALMFVRVASVLVCLAPIPLAIFAPDVLKVTFLAKSLRLTLAVLVLFIFYAPRFGSPRGALSSILLSLVLTVGWYLAGNPYGIDNAYVALAIPLVIMPISHLPRLFSSSSARAMRDTA